jgi:mono/diheme cytochrome c family protein
MRSSLLSAALGMVGTVLATLQPADAQGSLGDAKSGHQLAIDLCSGCHRVDSSTFGIFAANFEEVAKMPSTTALSLRVFLQSSHKNMPNIMLGPKQIDDVISYILSLREK